jgi:MFS transporter, SP family, arabinose:H+ symporter
MLHQIYNQANARQPDSKLMSLSSACGRSKFAFRSRKTAPVGQTSVECAPRIMALNPYLIRSTAVAGLGGLLFGFDTAVISGTTRSLSEIYNLSPWLLGVTVFGALLGTILGSLLAGLPGDRFGRRDSLRILAILYLVSALGCAFAWNWTALVAFRFIGGLGIGGSSVLGPMYIAEVAPAKYRGRLVGFFQFNVVLGILLAYLSNYVVGLFQLGVAEWRWKFAVPALPAALFFGLLFTIPRSPRWLVKKGRIAEAREVLQAIGEENFDQELQDIVQSIDTEHAESDRLFTWKYRLPIFLAVSIGMFNQLSGINAILYYINNIFVQAGFGKVSGDLQAVAIGGTNLLFTMIAMSVIDRIGRKTLLLVGSIGTAACLAGVAYIFFTAHHQSFLVWLLVGFIAFFAFSQGAVIWVYIGEVFPNQVRAKGQSLGSFSHWFMNGLISLTFPLMAASSGAYPFVFFSAMMLLQLFVVAFFYPETKGVSLEEMQRKLGIV